MRYPTWTHSLSACLLIFASGYPSIAAPPATNAAPPATNAAPPATNAAPPAPKVTPTSHNAAPASDPKSSIPSAGSAGLTFKSPAALKYKVPLKLPLMDIAIPQTYAGLMPLSDKPHETEKLFFWVIPTQNPKATKDLALWTNGGPGCSSMLGALQENGPIMWDAGRAKPILNPNSWSQAANIVYLEHPVNVGFSSGQEVINNENQVAEYIFKFLTRFLTIFPEFKGGNFYLTGESYAGMYLSYTADLIYTRQKELAMQLKGVLFVDPVLTPSMYQEDAAIYPFVKEHASAFRFNSTVMRLLKDLHHYCGYDNLLAKYLKYPPPGPFPETTETGTCQIWYTMADNLPADFNVYNILQKIKGDDPLVGTDTKNTYLSNPKVRLAFNVPENGNWTACAGASGANIFPNGDSSDAPSRKVLPNIIGKGKTIIAHGVLDGRLILQGMKLGLQSMTWQGKQGFQEPMTKKFLVDGKPNGLFQTERNLTFIAVNGAGHMIPHDQPQAGLAIFKYLVGAIDSLGTA